MLVMICGLPGTGKSITAKQIASDIGANTLRTDSIRKEMFKQGSLGEIMNSDNPFQFDLESVFDKQKEIPEKYQRLIWRQKDWVYDKLFKEISAALSKGMNIVLDATFYSKELRKNIYEIAKKANTKVFLVECVCDEKILQKRLERRTRRADSFSHTESMEVYKVLKEKFEDPIKDLMPTFVFDTGEQKVKYLNFSEEDKVEFEKLRYSLEKLNLKFSGISIR